MKKISALVLLAIVANLVLGTLPAFAESPVEGQSCNRVGEKSGGLICSRMCGNVWTVPGRCPRGGVPATSVTAWDFTPTGVVNDTARTEIYTVKQGDTLFGIAQGYHTTVETIKNANGLTGNNIGVGQKLTIPLLVGAVAVAAADGPLPFGDAVAIGLLAAGAALLSSQQIQVPDHIGNHPRGDVTSQLKTDAWKVAMAAWFGGQPPDWCGERHDGVKLVVYYSLGILRSTGKGIHRGLALILNGQSGSSTSIWDIRANSDGSPRGNGMDGFTKIPCPPPFSPAY